MSVFFFKQKTAYEMRISDWSSDVCSSDLIGHSFRKMDWHASFVDTDDPANVAAAITDKTRCIFVESLANPGGVVSDLAALATIAHDAGVPLIVDNTLASPVLSRPIEHGADIVVQSTTTRSEEPTSELQSLMPISSAVICLEKHTYTQP